MTIYLVHVYRSRSFIQTYKFDSFQKAHSFENKMLESGYACCFGPDHPLTIEEDRHEQLSLF